MQRYYLDTSIWRDYYENRSDKFRPLGEWALKLIKEIIANDDKIIISNAVIDELKKGYTEAKIKSIFSIAPAKNIEIVDLEEKHIKEAVEMNKKFKIGVMDIAHALIAKENKAVLVSRDRHFFALTGIVDIKKPEDLI